MTSVPAGEAMWILALMLVWPVAAAQAGAPKDLLLPIDCEPGVDCWMVRYVDHDPGPGVRDYACGKLAGDGHKGTDFAIRDLATMVAGVEVRAAAAGVVEALRDGMLDQSLDEGGREALGGRSCGNGIRLDHGDGWSTWYCHLRRGSLMVQEGDPVEAGQALALVGLSGETTFPHLHFDLRQGDRAVDPFVGAGAQGCGQGERPLWQAGVLAALAYQPVALVHAGIAPTPPKAEDARRGYHDRAALAVTSPVLELWVDGYWVEAGDRVRFTITGPDGAPVLAHTVALERSFARWFQFVGARRPGDAWPAGTYSGEVTLQRDGLAPISLERVVELR
jgi:murein DD-endopeptidase MepM/ murein hydrolase activator NlpD